MNPLLAEATEREPVRPGDARSGATFERFQVGDARYFVKRVSPARDWIMRATGDRDFRTLKVWRAGLMHRASRVVEHAVVDVELADGELVVLMRDVGELLVPDGDGPIDLGVHRALLSGMAAFAAEFWGWDDDIGLTPLADRFGVFAPANIADELSRPDPSPVLQAAETGWGLLGERAPELASVARAVHARPAALAGALERSPRTFLHGDWKMSNLGRCPDGRTVLLDWTFLGAGPVCWELGWYLALNRARLPEPKEEAIAAFRAALDRRGLDPDAWFDRQLTLCLLAIAATFGWEKALGGGAELQWWAQRAQVGAALLDREEPGWR
jgi:hypothetical protein